MNLEIPNHVAIILDGNRRWARRHGLANLIGHQKGAENIIKMTTYVFEKGVKYLSIFAFSTENFSRSSEEVDYLMDLFVNEFKSKYKKLHKENIKVVFSGRREPLKEEVLEAMASITDLTKDNTGGILNICLNYGGHAEIVDATKKIIKEIEEKHLAVEDINEDVFAKYLYQPLPPIDLLIRTSGEVRVSNFMLWEMAYAEFYFPEVEWPAFNKKEFDKAIDVYNHRERSFGGDKK